MKFRLDMDAETRDLVRHLPPEPKHRVKQGLRRIADAPSVGKPLQEELAGLFSHRIGTLRIVYAVSAAKAAVQIVAIGPRRTIYEILARSQGARHR